MTNSAIFPDLKGQSVFITGGGSGIGSFLTEGFLAQGAKVAFVQRSNADAFLDGIAGKYLFEPLAIQGDISNMAVLKSALDQAAEINGPITTLVNNAANDKRHSTAEVTEDFWDNMIDVNLKAYFFACQHVINGMTQNGGGSIINFSSISYMMGNAGYPIYTASNAGINGMTRSLAREFGPDNIRVNALTPGWVLTDKQKDQWVTPEALTAHIGRQCLKTTISPQDIVDPVLFLASISSKMMTGQALVVDAGVVVTG